MEGPVPGVREAGTARRGKEADLPSIGSSPAAAPLFRRIGADLSVQIRSGRWRVDQEIPSETQLCQHYGVSRGTVRQALADLVQQGLIHRKQGRGSFVRRPKLEGSVLGSYHQYMSKVPLDARSHVLMCRRRKPPARVQQILGLPEGDLVYELHRIRYVNAMPISLQVSYLPARLCPGLREADLSVDLAKETLYNVLERQYGVTFLRAEEFLEPVLADAHVAQHLHIPCHAPVFLVERTSYMADDRAGEFRRAHMRGDIYRFRIDLR